MTGTARLRGMNWDHRRGYDPMVATSSRYSEFNPGVGIEWERRPLQAFDDAPGIDGNGPRGTVLGGVGISVSSASRHREAAIDYAFWIAGADCQAGLYFDAGGQPGHAAAWDSDACNDASRNFFRKTRRTLETAWVRPRHPGYMRFQDRAGGIVHACLRGDLGIEAAIAQLQDAFQLSIEDRHQTGSCADGKGFPGELLESAGPETGPFWDQRPNPPILLHSAACPKGSLTNIGGCLCAFIVLKCMH